MAYEVSHNLWGKRETRLGKETGFGLSAEDVGFEPTKVSLAGFQDRCTRPLCESSVGEITRGVGVFKNGWRLSGQIEQGFESDSYSILITWPSNALGVLGCIRVA